MGSQVSKGTRLLGSVVLSHRRSPHRFPSSLASELALVGSEMPDGQVWLQSSSPKLGHREQDPFGQE